jgi:hypothetical protein
MFKRESVRLPARKPDGTATRTHPLIWGLQNAYDVGLTDADVARTLGVAPQTLWIWKSKAAADRHFLLPAEQIPTLSSALGIAPYYFRPDLWPNASWGF